LLPPPLFSSAIIVTPLFNKENIEKYLLSSVWAILALTGFFLLNHHEHYHKTNFLFALFLDQQ